MSFEPYSGPGPWPEDGVPLPGDAVEDRTYNWRVTSRGKGEILLDFGDETSDFADKIGATAVTHAVGEALIKIGTHLLGSRIGDEEDDW